MVRAFLLENEPRCGIIRGERVGHCWSIRTLAADRRPCGSRPQAPRRGGSSRPGGMDARTVKQPMASRPVLPKRAMGAIHGLYQRGTYVLCEAFLQ
jgi:hypothetical protein